MQELFLGKEKVSLLERCSISGVPLERGFSVVYTSIAMQSVAL